MQRSGKRKLPSFLPECIIAILACVIFLSMGSFESGAGSLLHVRGMTSMINDMPLNIVEDDTLNLTISALDEGKIVSYQIQPLMLCGNMPDQLAGYDLMRVVIIGLTDDIGMHKDVDETIQMLSTLFSTELNAEEAEENK